MRRLARKFLLPAKEGWLGTNHSSVYLLLVRKAAGGHERTLQLDLDTSTALYTRGSRCAALA